MTWTCKHNSSGRHRPPEAVPAGYYIGFVRPSLSDKDWNGGFWPPFQIA